MASTISRARSTGMVDEAYNARIVWIRKNSHPSTGYVYLSLTTMLRQSNGEITATVENIARNAGYSETTTGKALDWLVEHNVICRKKAPTGNSYTYLLNPAEVRRGNMDPSHYPFNAAIAEQRKKARKKPAAPSEPKPGRPRDPEPSKGALRARAFRERKAERQAYEDMIQALSGVTKPTLTIVPTEEQKELTA